ncbi:MULTISPECIES: hypothetical protein [unclassified Janibacter]|uniref:hypothetical protein n=1 Tax=unclassified Janibacter TaxID=2649294 RepID=UPI003D05A2CA
MTTTAGDPGLLPGAPALGVDLGIGDELDAEHVIGDACAALVAAGLGDGCWVTTHAVGGTTGGPGDRSPRRHSAMVVVLPAAAGRGDAEIVGLVASAFGGHGGLGEPVVVLGDATAGAGSGQLAGSGAEQALVARRAGEQGRAVVYPGSDALVGTVTVADVLATAVDDVVLLGGGEVAPDARLATRDFVRPRRAGGRWVLHVMPSVGGTLVPFEEPDPKRCCQDK